MAALMRALLALPFLLFCLPAQAEVVSGVIAWIGSAVGSTAFTAAVAVVSIASTAYQANQQKKKARQEAARQLSQDIANIQDRTVNLLQTDSPHPTIYGEPGRVGGSLVAMITSGSAAQLCHLVYVFAAHECEAVDEVYIEDDPVQAGEDGWTTNEALIKAPSAALDFDIGPMVHTSVHLSPGGVDTADQWLIDTCNNGHAAGMWTQDHKLSGFTYVIVTVKTR